ncbi:MAG TPA: TIGR02281 family clan AA aspartic protease [Ramlibacter sp.]|nr:TIGR02281 family clan AA aspartic protease [Ramlibacter sp.]
MRSGVALLLLAAAGWAQAQSVALQGMLGSKALLIVDGGAPRSVAPGETHQGVKVLSTSGDQAVVEINGKRHSLRVGDAPASVGSGAAGPRGNRIVLTASTNGHFLSQGAINGRAAYFMVDTGASGVGIGAPDAERLGINYRAGRPVRLNTANGVAQGWFVKLASVRIGDVEVYEVDAVVGEQPMPYVLLGNSFLTRFQMKRDNDQMVLERRY